MLRTINVIILIFVMALLPYESAALEIVASKIQVGARVISFCNIVLFITSIISIKQFFLPGDNNRMPFHVFNIIFVVLFYGIGLPFLIINREYYEGYGTLSPIGVLQRFFFSLDISSFAQSIIVASTIFNVLYIRRYYRDYFEAGVAGPEHHNKVNTATSADVEADVLQD